MIDFGSFEFAAPPGVGADWVMRALLKAGIQRPLGGEYWSSFDFSPHRQKSLRVSMVRHPCDLLAVCWREMNEEVNGRPLPFSALRRDSFDAFVRDFLLSHPGRIGRLFDLYQADTCMRYEDQPWALLELLESVGVPAQMRKFAKKVPRPPSPIIRWDKSLRRRVVESEKETMEKYDYVW